MPNSLQRIFWIASTLIALVECAVIFRSVAEKKVWSETPTLELKELNLQSTPGRYSFHENADRLEEASEQLSFASGLYGNFVSPENSMDFFFLRYEPGNPRFIEDIFGHAPDVCMRSTGATLRREHPQRTLSMNGSALPVRIFEFELPHTTKPLWVFRMTWIPEQSFYSRNQISDRSRLTKLAAGFRADSRPPARILLAAGRNFPELDESWTAFRELIGSHLSLNSQPGNEFPPLAVACHE